MESINIGIYQVMVNGYTIPTQFVENKILEKPFESWNLEKLEKENMILRL